MPRRCGWWPGAATRRSSRPGMAWCSPRPASTRATSRTARWRCCRSTPTRRRARIRDTLQAEIGVDVAVIISDTMGRPWRDGVVDTAIGAAGLDMLWDLRGQRDTAGHLLEATVIAIGDELASAAELVKGKLAATPVAVIRGFPFTRSDPDRGARPLIRPSADDMFRLGTREAKHQVVPTRLRSCLAPKVKSALTRNTDPALVQAALDAVVSDGVTLSVELGRWHRERDW